MAPKPKLSLLLSLYSVTAFTLRLLNILPYPHPLFLRKKNQFHPLSKQMSGIPILEKKKAKVNASVVEINAFLKETFMLAILFQKFMEVLRMLLICALSVLPVIAVWELKICSSL
jgi:hypothetical protein